MTMHNDNPDYLPPATRGVKCLGAAAVAALSPAALSTAAILPSQPTAAHADAPLFAQPIRACPSFADIVERVKPAVVS